MPRRRSPRGRPGTSRFQRIASSGSCFSPTARTRRSASYCARRWRRSRTSATAGASHTRLMSSPASLTEKNVTQFAPVSLVSASAYVVAASPGVAAADIRGLIALAKASPGKLGFGSSGTGAASHLSAELFKSMAGVDLLHVPYKGTGQALTDLLAGHVDLMFAPAQTGVAHVPSGQMKA